MRTVTHREMRNNSGEILRAVAAGEPVQVTNNGTIAAVISPPSEDVLSDLVARGWPASRPLTDLVSNRRCAASRANRHPDELDRTSVQQVLDAVTLVDLARGDLLTARTVPGRLRSNDAIHLTVALRVGADEIITYDRELASSTWAAGLAVAGPGAVGQGSDRPPLIEDDPE